MKEILYYHRKLLFVNCTNIYERVWGLKIRSNPRKGKDMPPLLAFLCNGGKLKNSCSTEEVTEK